MPLTAKGQKIKAAMEKEYGAKKGAQVFYATENKGKIKGVTKARKSRKAKKQSGEHMLAKAMGMK